MKVLLWRSYLKNRAQHREQNPIVVAHIQSWLIFKGQSITQFDCMQGCQIVFNFRNVYLSKQRTKFIGNLIWYAFNWLTMHFCIWLYKSAKSYTFLLHIICYETCTFFETYFCFTFTQTVVVICLKVKSLFLCTQHVSTKLFKLVV